MNLLTYFSTKGETEWKTCQWQRQVQSSESNEGFDSFNHKCIYGTDAVAAHTKFALG